LGQLPGQSVYWRRQYFHLPQVQRGGFGASGSGGQNNPKLFRVIRTPFSTREKTREINTNYNPIRPTKNPRTNSVAFPFGSVSITPPRHVRLPQSRSSGRGHNGSQCAGRPRPPT